MTSFRQVVADALVDCRDEGVLREDQRLDQLRPVLAQRIFDRLKEAGFSIHRSGECVHPHSRRQDLGREMTPEEVERYGV